MKGGCLIHRYRRYAGFVAFAILAISSNLFAQPGPQGGDTKPPWLWSADERVQERFRPDAAAARRESAMRRMRKAPDGMWPIDGNVNPELFFPWELMDRLLRFQSAEPSRLILMREALRGDIASAGWDYDDFWRELDGAAGNYNAAFRQALDEQEASRGRRESRSPDRAAAVDLEICRSRAEALRAMRERFGRESFDKFLYTAMARGYVTWSNGKRDAATLRRVEAGCR